MNQELRTRVLNNIMSKGYVRKSEPFVLSSGALSYDYIDLRRAFSNGKNLKDAASLLVELISEHLGELKTVAIGGMTMGADPLAHAVAVLTGWSWFSVRKDQKTHGTRNIVEGAEIQNGHNVIVIEDTTTTGTSLLKAINTVSDKHANILLALTVLNRGNKANILMQANNINFMSIFTYKDLNIDPIE